MTAFRKIDSCKACGAPIVWARTSAGKNMPVDAARSDDGNVLLFPVDRSAQLAVVMTKEEAAAKSVDRYKSHFATCPSAARFRKTKP